jgi:hypothetical protein
MRFPNARLTVSQEPTFWREDPLVAGGAVLLSIGHDTDESWSQVLDEAIKSGPPNTFGCARCER